MYQYVHGDVAKLPLVEYIYIAGPFFNPAQLNIVEMIEHECENARRWAFSPRLQHGNKTAKIETAEQAKVVFDQNVEGLRDLGAMIFIADYLLPPRSSLQVCKDGVPTFPVSIPDAGAIFELGMAYAQYFDDTSLDIVIFTTNPNPEEARLNIMLSQAARGVLYGFDALRYWLEHPTAADSVKPWQGKHI